MSITDNYVPVKQTGNGVTVAFSGNWNMIAATYCRVYWEDKTTGVQTLKTLNTHYTLAFTEAGFTVTHDALYIPPSTVWVIVARSTALDQNVPYKTSSGFDGKVIENSFDKVTAEVQDAKDGINRSIKFALGSTTESFIAEPVDGEYLKWDGTDIVSVEFADIGIITADATFSGLIAGDFLVYGAGVWNNIHPVDVGAALDLEIGVDVQAYDAGLDQIAALADPNADRILFWDDSAGAYAYLTPGSGLLITTTTIDVVGKRILGTAYAESSALDSTTTVLPIDDTIPQSGEGDEALTVAYTRISATSKLVIEAGTTLSASANLNAAIALFQDSGADALAASAQYVGATNVSSNVSLKYEMTSGATGATTFKLRYGGQAGTIYLNGFNTARIFGAIPKTFLRVTEIEA